MAYTAIVDVVGTRALAKSSHREYSRLIGLFHEHVFDLSLSLSDSGKLYFFGDTFFAQDQRQHSLVSFIMDLRSVLFEDSVFIRGVIREGDLEPRLASQYEFVILDPPTKRLVEKRVEGRTFGEVAAQLYTDRERLKGIGLAIPESAVKKWLVQHDIEATETCHLPQSSSRSPQVFTDLPLQDRDFEPGILHNILNEFYQAKMLSLKLGRFFIPLLVLWVRCMDLNNSLKEVELDSDDNLLSIMLNGSFDHLFGNVVGVEQIYFALLDRVLTDESPLSLQSAVWNYIESNQKLLDQLRYVPVEILSDETRRRCYAIMADRILRTSIQS